MKYVISYSERNTDTLCYTWDFVDALYWYSEMNERYAVFIQRKKFLMYIHETWWVHCIHIVWKKGPIWDALYSYMRRCICFFFIQEKKCEVHCIYAVKYMSGMHCIRDGLYSYILLIHSIKDTLYLYSERNVRRIALM